MHLMGGEHSTKRRRRKKSPDGAGEKRPEDGSLGVLDHQQGRGALTLVLIQSGCNVTIVLYRVFFLQQRCLFKIKTSQSTIY